MLSIIVPVYNEENTIIDVLNKLLSLNVDKEIIVVNDGSTDNTKQRLNETANNSKIKQISLSTNKGKGNAIREGLKVASGDIVAIQDADLEYNPDDMITLFNILKDRDVEVIYGDRFCFDYETPIWHRMGNRCLSIFSSLLYFSWVKDMETCYKLMYRKNWLSLELKSDRFEVEAEITAKVLRSKFKFCQHPISYRFRSYGEGKKISYKDGLRSISVLFKYRFQY
ncbi:MAG: glycosyltransferase family 2 protein [Candidatus Kaelpia aquatica]|nr:glycosyltransferase family 2 protein [Candidatus Kaelpia aquatica]